ncbi:hypothetical protein [Pseudonocardia sp. ICBG1034]|uniref:hypothetical protein n=1 Tax=Pseudonocardia sp. ICBG1034 TaxID=2844381 RepID=UPI001CCA9877|nr:hypothetical protein [Pseudonocardia sp. ICBG1034]
MIDRIILDNLSAVTTAGGRSGRLLRRRRLRAAATEAATRLMVKYHSLDDPVGGNQQKVVLAKWLGAESRVFLLDDPTRGIDIGAKYEIYRMIHAAAAAGAAVLFSSSELEDYGHLCRRVLVLRRGALRAELTGPDITPARLLDAMNT